MSKMHKNKLKSDAISQVFAYCYECGKEICEDFSVDVSAYAETEMCDGCWIRGALYKKEHEFEVLSGLGWL